MGRAIVISLMVVVLGALAVFLVVWLARLGHRERAAEKGWALKGDLSKTQEEALLAELDTAAGIFEAITGLNGRFDDMSYLKDKHRDQVEIWLRTYNKRRNT